MLGIFGNSGYLKPKGGPIYAGNGYSEKFRGRGGYYLLDEVGNREI